MQSIIGYVLDTSSEEAHSQLFESSLNEPDVSELLLSMNSLLSLFDEDLKILFTADVRSFSFS